MINPNTKVRFKKNEFTITSYECNSYEENKYMLDHHYVAYESDIEPVCTIGNFGLKKAIVGTTQYYTYTSNIFPDKYIINDGATILFWNDGTKTISKRHKEDEYDKELGFLFAYYYKKCRLSKSARKRVIECIDYSKIKTFLFEMFVKETGFEPEKAKKYLERL